MSLMTDAIHYLQRAQTVAERKAVRGERSTTMGEVAIAQALLVVAEAIEKAAKPPIVVNVDPPIVPEAVAYCAHLNVPGHCIHGCKRAASPEPEDKPVPRCTRRIMVEGVGYVCTSQPGRNYHSTDTASGRSIHTARMISGDRITWTTAK